MRHQLDDSLASAVLVPLPGETGRDGRHLCAGDGEPAPVEVRPQWQCDLAAPEPRGDQKGALVLQSPEPEPDCFGIAGDLDDEREPSVVELFRVDHRQAGNGAHHGEVFRGLMARPVARGQARQRAADLHVQVLFGDHLLLLSGFSLPTALRLCLGELPPRFLFR